jgi:hypothetical protein
VAHSSGRLLLADPVGGGRAVADLTCDLADLVWVDRTGWLVGAYGAALVGIGSAL